MMFLPALVKEHGDVVAATDGKEAEKQVVKRSASVALLIIEKELIIESRRGEERSK